MSKSDQKFSDRLLTLRPLLNPKLFRVGFCCGQSLNGTGFSPRTSGFSCQHISICASYTFTHLSPTRCTFMSTVSLKTRLKLSLKEDDISGTRGGYESGNKRKTSAGKHEGNRIICDTAAWEISAWQTSTLQRQFIRVPVQKNVTKQHLGLYQQTKIYGPYSNYIWNATSELPAFTLIIVKELLILNYKTDSNNTRAYYYYYYYY